MSLLLDSHTFVWWRDEPNKISPAAFAEISNPANGVFLSVVTVWELQIKIALNKFAVKGGLGNAVEDEQQKNNFQILPVKLSHALYLENLPLHHKDPFDRLLDFTGDCRKYDFDQRGCGFFSISSKIVVVKLSEPVTIRQ